MVNKNYTKQIFINIFFVVICFLALIPILYALSVSFSSGSSMLTGSLINSINPKNFTLKNYSKVLTEKPVLLWLGNTLVMAVSTVAFTLGISIPAAYVFSRKRFTGQKNIIKILIILNAFPSILSMFAIYKILSPLGLVNNRFGIILIYTGMMASFGLWNLKGYFDTIPYDIENSARIDGAKDFQIVLLIVLPLARPAIVVTAVMVLIQVWNEYIYATTFLTGADKYTLAAGLYSLQAGEMSGSWPVFAAASLMISLPILVIFLAVQKHMITGLSAGGVKE